MRIALVILTLVIAALAYEREFGQGGRRDVADLKAQLAAQNTRLEALSARNDSLAAEVSDLKDGSAAIEGIARAELGMVRRGETFVQVFGGDERPAEAPRRVPGPIRPSGEP